MFAREKLLAVMVAVAAAALTLAVPAAAQQRDDPPGYHGEIMPFGGVTGSPHANDTPVKGFGGLAVRGYILPVLQDEISVAYRSESLAGGFERRHMWPVTASLWLYPVPMLYGGAGVGWYMTTYTYDQSRFPGVSDQTKQQFGVHVGGGVRVPLAPSTALDLNGRYVMLRDQQSVLVPQHFDPNFWDASLGLAFRF